MTGNLTPRYAALADAVQARFGERVRRLAASGRNLGFEVDADALTDVCLALRDEDDFRFEMLMDVSGIDYLHYGSDEWNTHAASNTGFSRGVRHGAAAQVNDVDIVTYRPSARFAVNYQLQSISRNIRLRLRAFCANDDIPMIDSVNSIWESANWYEREAFDLFGILFRGHPDLRRLLTDYGFIGHPFRKDFPLIGNVEMRYDPDKGRVVYEPVSIEPRTLVPKVIRDDARYGLESKDNGDA